MKINGTVIRNTEYNYKSVPQVPSNKESPLAKDLEQLHLTAQKEKKIRIGGRDNIKQAYFSKEQYKSTISFQGHYANTHTFSHPKISQFYNPFCIY
jgi:hypothetical protein